MGSAISFDEVLDAIEHLPADQQADLIEIMRRRLSERARRQVAEDAREARAEHAAGQTRPVSVQDLMGEIET